MSVLNRVPLRVRLVAGFSAAMLVVLSGAGACVYWRVQYALDRGLDVELNKAAATIAPLVDDRGTIAADDLRAARATGVSWQVLDGEGAVLAAEGALGPAAAVPASALPPSGGTATAEVGRLLPVNTDPYRLRLTSLSRPDDAVLVVGLGRNSRDEALRELLLQLGLAGLGALVVTGVVGDRLARAALGPVEAYRREAAAVARGARGVRLAVPAVRDDEVTRLGHTLNTMLDTQDAVLDRERRFVAEASHELRTPLTLLRSRIQLARRRTRTTAELEDVLDELEVDVNRLAGLADDLLAVTASTASEAHGSRRGDRSAHCDVGETVGDVVARFDAGTPGAAVTFEQEACDPIAEPVAAGVTMHKDDLDRALTNLLTNAATRGASPVGVRVRSTPRWCVVEVTDSGPGMRPDLLATATRRSTRADEARSRPGAGLGLSLVENLVAGAGGELRLCFDGHRAVHPDTVTSIPCSHGASMTASLVIPCIGH